MFLSDLFAFFFCFVFNREIFEYIKSVYQVYFFFLNVQVYVYHDMTATHTVVLFPLRLSHDDSPTIFYLHLLYDSLVFDILELTVRFFVSNQILLISIDKY